MKGLKLYLPHSIVTLVAGLMFWLVGESIYNNWILNKTATLTLPLYFLLFMGFLSVVLWVLSVRRGVYFTARDKKHTASGTTRMILILLAVLTVCSGLLELLYELGGKIIPSSATSYVFLIDDSGSMADNDPNFERNAAIGSIMSEMGSSIPYAVYVFSDNARCDKEMSLTSFSDIAFNNSGGTDIVNGLRTVYNDLEKQKGLWGTHPKVLLLTDGQSSGFGLEATLKNYRKSRVNISAVGFGWADEEYMTNIARKTGGVYVRSDDISTLRQSMEEALHSYSENKRNLLSDRFCEHDGLYGFLRILFLFIISLLIALIKSFATFDDNRRPIYFLISAVLGLLAAIMMEVMISSSGTPERTAHLWCCLLWSFLPAKDGNTDRNIVGKPLSALDDIDGDSRGYTSTGNKLSFEDDDEDSGPKSFDF